MANALKTLFTDIATAIRETLTDEPAMSPLSYPDKIREVAKSGGSPSFLKYVTFMSEDGNTELFKMPVISGDDCKDPIVHGDISEPTKESSNTQHFTYSGWSSTSGGDVDTSVLENITEDKIVYASYKASVRYYTVRYYDDDNTLLSTVQVTYGADATNSYVPIKEGYALTGWNPSVDNVISDIDTFAVWEVEINQGWLVPMAYPDVAPAGVGVQGLVYSKDGTRLYVADSSAGKIKVYDATTVPYTYLTELYVFCNPPSQLTLSPDGKKLVAIGSNASQTINQTITVYDINEDDTFGVTLINGKFPSSQTNVYASINPSDVVFTNDGNLLLCGTNGQIVPINLETNTASIYTAGLGEQAKRVLIENGTKLVTIKSGGIYSRNIAVYDVENSFADVTNNYFDNSTTPSTISGMGDIVCTSDEKYIMCGGTETYGHSYTVFRYDTTTTPFTRTGALGTDDSLGNIYDLAISPDDKMCACGGSIAPYLAVYDIETMEAKDAPVTPPNASVRACAFNHDGTHLAVAFNAEPYLMIYQVKE